MALSQHKHSLIFGLEIHYHYNTIFQPLQSPDLDWRIAAKIALRIKFILFWGAVGCTFEPNRLRYG
jgi:hypothetical protein